MRSSIDLIFNAFLSKQPEEKRARLLQLLPMAEQERLQHLPSFAKGSSLPPCSSDALLERIHWSWLLAPLTAASESDQSLFLAALDSSAAESLLPHLSCKQLKSPLTPLGTNYLRQELLNRLVGSHDRLVPMDYLPPSSLNRILNLSKRQLTGLIDLLAMHDLSLEMRQIVETKILKRVYSFLTEPQKKFLKQLAAKPEPFALAKIGLDRWNGEEEPLKHNLHKRGLARLGLALSTQDPALIWYVCHQLDVGRGTALCKLCIKEGAGSLAELAARQVDELLGHESL